jgi:hypothetical protein
MFNEMSIRENLHFNQKLSAVRVLRIVEVRAGHAALQIMLLVFMIRGLCRKWKEPVAYYFTCGSTKAEVILQYLKEVLDACKNTGLKVIATDMGVIIVKALKPLSATKKKPLFRYHI